jgi:hypothetical protein
MTAELPWTALQSEICMNVANAKFYAFAAEAERLAHWVRIGVVSKSAAADYLNESASYNQLYFEYGADRIQAVMSEAFEVAA